MGATDQTSKWSTPIKVPKGRRVISEALLSRVRYDLGFTANVRFDGGPDSCMAVGHRHGNLTLFANSPGGWFTVVPVDGFTTDGTAVLVHVAGTMKDVQGTNVVVETREYPLHAAEGADPVRSHTVQNAHALPREIAVATVE